MNRLVTADASCVSGADFLNQVFGGSSREELYAELCERCIGVIARGGSLYGYPPLMIGDCRKIMAERDLLGEQVERELRRTIEIQGDAARAARAASLWPQPASRFSQSGIAIARKSA